MSWFGKGDGLVDHDGGMRVDLMGRWNASRLLEKRTMDTLEGLEDGDDEHLFNVEHAYGLVP